MTTGRFSALAGPIARAMALVHEQRQPGQDVRGRIQCTRCRATLNFCVQPNGLSRGQCVAAGCVRWCQ